MPASKLSYKLAHQLAWCLEHAGKRRQESYPGGLIIILYVDLAGRRHVCLARKGATGPSDQEARTVVAHWPEPAPAGVTWSTAELRGLKVMLSLWAVPESVKQLELSNDHE